MKMLHSKRTVLITIGFLSVLSLVADATPITAQKLSSSLLSRSSTSPSCSVPGYQQCSGSASSVFSGINLNVTFPDGFCCPQGTTCQSSDQGSTLICCPQGRNCTSIETIACDISLQNATAAPNSVIKTTKLNDNLPKCGDACCPFGYSCSEQGYCKVVHERKPDLNHVDVTGTAIPSATATASSISSTPPTTTADGAGGTSGDGGNHDGYPGKAVGLGFGLGTLAGIVFALSCISCLHCFQRNKQTKPDDGAGAGKLYTPALFRSNLNCGSKDRVNAPPQKPYPLTFLERHRKQSPFSLQNPFKKGYYDQPTSVNSGECSRSRSLTSSANTPSHISTHSAATLGKQPRTRTSPAGSGDIPHRTSSLNKGGSSINEEGNANIGGEGGSGIPKHMGHEVLFRPRNMGVSLDSYDARTWNRSVGRRSEQGPGRGSMDDGGKWRSYDGGVVGSGTNQSSWSDIVNESKRAG